MTEEVLVTIKGLHAIAEDNQDEVEVVTSGKYKKMGNRHYVTYEEVVEGSTQKIQNLIKLADDGVVEVTKKGASNVHMSFERDKKNLTYYDTPYGSLLLGIAATNIDVKSETDAIDVKVHYALDINYEHMADCTLTMNIRSKSLQDICFG